MWTSLPSKNQTETIGMVIKNQNAPYGFVVNIRWQ